MLNQSISTQRMFIGALLIIVALLTAFPLYQAASTNGYIFYSNAIDEASYLSFPYSEILLTWKGLTRYSSALIVWLHTFGMSGGYCNITLDLLCVVAFLFATRRAFKRYGLNAEDASLSALLLFIFPLLTTPWNPFLSQLKSYIVSNDLSHWVTMAPNGELLFLRSPEPQLSWTIIALIISYTTNARYLPWILLISCPLLYSFVRIPLAFVILTLQLPNTLFFLVRSLIAFTALGSLVGWFMDHSVAPGLHRFAVESRAPVVPVSALIASALWIWIKRYLPSEWRSLFSTLVASTWIGANIQIVSGWMISPSKYDEYWSAAVLALLASLAIVLHSRHKRGWLVAALCVFILHSSELFSQNLAILRRLENPNSVIDLLKTSPERVAFNDILLATHADLIHPRQNHTLLSYTRTYTLDSRRNLELYLCAKRESETQGEHIAKLFSDIFRRLDDGYQRRGVDDIITMQRRSDELTNSSLSLPDLECGSLNPPEFLTSSSR